MDPVGEGITGAIHCSTDVFDVSWWLHHTNTLVPFPGTLIHLMYCNLFRQRRGVRRPRDVGRWFNDLYDICLKGSDI